MAHFLPAPSQYLSKYCEIISEVFWHSPAQEIPIFDMSLKITNLRPQPYLPRANE